MHLIHLARDMMKHPDAYLGPFALHHPVGVYLILMVIVFCETGLVVTPFLPGDSLLFAVGALAAAAESHLSLPLVIVLLCVAANCGDLVNYTLGRRLGPRVFFTPSLAPKATADAAGPLDYAPPALAQPALWQRLLSQKHLAEAQAFYERHGRMTIILARFVPIIRTFAPFVAGVGQMTFGRFVGFSVGGGVLWVTLVSLAGYFFGGIPWVKTHFEVVVLAIIVISVLPVAFHALQARRRGTPDAGLTPATLAADVNA